VILTDAGYLIALVSARDALHERAPWSRRLIGEQALITEYVLIEAANHLRAPMHRHRLGALVEWIRTDSRCVFVPASPELFDGGWRLFQERRDKAWSLTDCISFYVMHERGIREALAYDEHFEQAGFVALLRRDP